MIKKGFINVYERFIPVEKPVEKYYLYPPNTL